MKEFVSGYGPLVQFVVAVYALLSSLLVAWIYVYNKRRLRKASKHELVVEIESFNRNQLDGLKAAKIVEDTKDRIGVEDLRALWMNAESRNKLLEKRLGSYDTIEKILALDSDVRFATRVTWIVGTGTFLLAVFLCILFWMWQPGNKSVGKVPVTDVTASKP